MEYLLKSTTILSLFYLFYKIFLQNETFFKSIRVYFLIGFISAIAIPLVIITKYIVVEPINLSNVNFVNTISVLSSQNFDWVQVIFITYLIGIMFFTLRFLVQFTSLIWFIYSHSKIKSGKYYIIKTDKNITPFSFFNYIIYNPSQFKELELKQIITHEKIHINQLHSLDIILSQLVLIINWFNPFVWLYNKEIQKNLEFIADEFTQNSLQEQKKYQHLLLKTISTNYQMALTINFYNSLIKKRIIMLQKNRSNKTMYFKFALIIPILIAFVFTFNTKVVAQKKSDFTVEIGTSRVDFFKIITKDTNNSELETIKNNFAKQGAQFKYSKLRKNKKGEIIGISISIKNKEGDKSEVKQKSDKPISPIKINLNLTTGELSIGNISNDEDIIKKGDSNQDVVWILKDSAKIIELKGSNSFLFFSDDDLHITNEKGDLTKVWVSKEGNSTKMKVIEFIEINEGSDAIDNVFIIKTDDDINATGGENENKMFISSMGDKPLFVLDEKEMKDKKIGDINPDTIKSITVIKGEKAIEKYGKKGKNGVIEIFTKKN